jgi:hypothetical protein
MSDHYQLIRSLEVRILQLESERRPRRRLAIAAGRRSRMLVALGLAVALVLPAVALASHQFSDVPNSNPFHDDIAAIAYAGITAGFGDGGYHPSDPVTRQAMAAFLHRSGGTVALAKGTDPVTLTVDALVDSYASGFVPVRQLTVIVPGTNNPFGPEQLVHLQGHVDVYTEVLNSVAGCPCEFAAFFRETTADTFLFAEFQTFESMTPYFIHSFEAEELFAASPGVHTYELQVGVYKRNSATSAATFHFDNHTSLSATTVPFGQ